jgi:hypothetical protein
VRFGFDALVDFVARHGGFPGCLDTKTDPVAFDVNHLDSYVMANNYGLANAAREYEHGVSPSLVLV